MAVSSAGKWSQIRPPSCVGHSCHRIARATRHWPPGAGGRPQAQRTSCSGTFRAREPRDAELLADVRSDAACRRPLGQERHQLGDLRAAAGARDRAPAAEHVHACDQTFGLGPEDRRHTPRRSRWTGAASSARSGRRRAGRSGARATTARCGRGSAERNSRCRGRRATPGSRSGTAYVAARRRARSTTRAAAVGSGAGRDGAAPGRRGGVARPPPPRAGARARRHRRSRRRSRPGPRSLPRRAARAPRRPRDPARARRGRRRLDLVPGVLRPVDRVRPGSARPPPPLAAGPRRPLGLALDPRAAGRPSAPAGRPAAAAPARARARSAAGAPGAVASRSIRGGSPGAGSRPIRGGRPGVGAGRGRA